MNEEFRAADELERMTFVKGVYQDLCQFLKPKWNTPLQEPVPVPCGLAERIREAVYEVEVYLESRYGVTLLKSAEDLMSMIFRRVWLEWYGEWAEGARKCLRNLEQYLFDTIFPSEEKSIAVHYGTLRTIKWKLMAYLNYRSAFG